MYVTKHIRILAPASMEKLASSLKQALTGYRIPGNVSKRTGIHSLEEVRDDWCIVICTPETPEDPEITREIGTFLEKGKRNQVLTILAEGSPDTSFPESLLYETLPDGTTIRHEPLAANIVGTDGLPDEKKLKVERLRLLAPILGVLFDDLRNRSRMRRNRILAAAGTVLLAGAAIFLGFAISRMRIMMRQNEDLQVQYEEAGQAMQEAEEQRDLAREALAETTALQAEIILAGNDPELALLLCLEYLPEMGHLTRLTDVFDRTLETLCAEGFVPVTTEKSYRRTREQEIGKAAPVALTDLGPRKDPTEGKPAEYLEKLMALELPFEVKEYWDHPGIPGKIFGLAEHGIAAMDADSLQLLYVIRDEITDRFTTAPNGSTYWDGTILAALPDGESRIVVGRTFVYDGADGTFLYEIEDYGLPGATGILRASAEGWLPMWLGDNLFVIDLADGHEIQALRSPGGNSHALYGEKDAVTDQTSASRLLIYTYPSVVLDAKPRIFWEYHAAATAIPEDLDGKIALAKELLGNRELIESEKKTYHLE